MKLGKIIIEVRGGVIQTVLSNIEDIEIEIIDHDDLECLDNNDNQPGIDADNFKTLY